MRHAERNPKLEAPARAALYERARGWAQSGRRLAPDCAECCLYEFAGTARLASVHGLTRAVGSGARGGPAAARVPRQPAALERRRRRRGGRALLRRFGLLPADAGLGVDELGHGPAQRRDARGRVRTAGGGDRGRAHPLSAGAGRGAALRRLAPHGCRRARGRTALARGRRGRPERRRGARARAAGRRSAAGLRALARRAGAALLAPTSGRLAAEAPVGGRAGGAPALLRR
ncbi:MAG: hypothetical protein MZV64_35265 [Ignavibacteriales bacterium]|nr:hypothetical protein [Ignavibacteriales bacterium]